MDDTWLGKMIDKMEAEDAAGRMSLHISEDGGSVELILDTASNYYSEWIPGEGGGIGLLMEMETKKVIGVHLPLYKRTLIVSGDVDSLDTELLTIKGTN